jgi:hypothetical protein
VTVHLFFNPDLVGQLAACGITARRRSLPGASATGFVLEGRRIPQRPREAVTNVIAVHGAVTITGPRQPSTERAPMLALSAATAAEPRTALDLVEECTRLRRSNQILTDEVARLRGEIARLTGSGAQPREHDFDDSVKRFSLLELDL